MATETPCSPVRQGWNDTTEPEEAAALKLQALERGRLARKANSGLFEVSRQAKVLQQAYRARR
jgi:hypothetical protein